MRMLPRARSGLMFAAAALLLHTATWAPPAWADSPETEPEPVAVVRALDAANGVFATLVGWMSDVMFFDLVFWDNTTTGPAAVGFEHDGERVTAVTDDGLEWRRVIEVQRPELVLEAPRETRMGQLDVVMYSGPTALTRPGVPSIVVEVPAQDVDLEALGLTRLQSDPPPEGERVQAVVHDLAPFPIRVDRVTGKTVASRIRLRPEMVTYQPGDLIRTREIELGRVESVGADGMVSALSVEARIDAEAVGNPHDVQVPAIVAWLIFGALFFTLRMSFVNVRMFRHAFAVTAGRYDTPGAVGEISHFQALSSALSATVGLGNIAGVAIAVSVGGPGAVFWMVVAGFLGMSSKFTECTLGQMYRIQRPDGSVSGGPMHYLGDGLAELNLPRLGRVLAVVFAVMCIGGSLGGGNMFQANQSSAAVFEVLAGAHIVSPDSAGIMSVVYGLVLAFVVGLVIIGGIQRIGAAAGMIVPFMCGLYVLAGLFVLLVNASAVPAAFETIVTKAFTFEAGLGGFVGVLIQGFRRAAFSNEAGVGSASIAHSAATTRYPVREGIVALLEPFIDTIIVCTMTGLVVVVTGAYLQDTAGNGVVMTQTAFGSVVWWFPMVLSVAVVLFAFSTMISWSYYGERCSVFLFGDGAKIPYRLVFLVCVFLGANFNLGAVLDFSDLMVLGMAFPNILGILFLTSKVRAALDDYTGRLAAGEFQVHPVGGAT